VDVLIPIRSNGITKTMRGHARRPNFCNGTHFVVFPVYCVTAFMVSVEV
jgi:hypothetical protein